MPQEAGSGEEAVTEEEEAERRERRTGRSLSRRGSSRSRWAESLVTVCLPWTEGPAGEGAAAAARLPCFSRRERCRSSAPTPSTRMWVSTRPARPHLEPSPSPPVRRARPPSPGSSAAPRPAVLQGQGGNASLSLRSPSPRSGGFS